MPVTTAPIRNSGKSEAQANSRKPVTRTRQPTIIDCRAPHRSASAPPKRNNPCWAKVRAPRTIPTAIVPMPKSSRMTTARKGTTEKKPRLKISWLASNSCGAGSVLGILCVVGGTGLVPCLGGDAVLTSGVAESSAEVTFHPIRIPDNENHSQYGEVLRGPYAWLWAGGTRRLPYLSIRCHLRCTPAKAVTTDWMTTRYMSCRYTNC